MVSRANTFVQHPPKMRAVVVTGSMPGNMFAVDFAVLAHQAGIR